MSDSDSVLSLLRWKNSYVEKTVMKAISLPQQEQKWKEQEQVQ